MTVILNGPDDFNLENLRRVALQGEKTRYSKTALKTIEAAHQAFQDYVEANRDSFIYGITSGYGPAAQRNTTPEETRRRQRHGIPFLGLSFGDGHLPETLTRATVFALLSMCANGSMATSAAQAEKLAVALDGSLPRIPAQGLTAPGEMLALFYLYRGLPLRSEEGWQASAGNGAPATAGMAGIAALQGRNRLALAERVFALSVEAFNAPLEAYDPALKQLWGDRYEARALDALNSYLKGAAAAARRGYQAPVSYRIIPRVLGQAERAVADLEEAAGIALGGAAPNPTYRPPDGKHRLGRILSSGAFQNALAPQALDAMSASWVDLASLAHRHIVKLHKGGVSHLPDRLLPQGTDYMTGRSTTYLEFVPNGFIDEMRRLAQPSLLSPAEPGASEQDDISVPGFMACRNEARVAELFDRVLAILAAVSSQALHVTERPPPPPLTSFLEAVRKVFPPVRSRRVLGRDAERLADAFSKSIAAGDPDLVGLLRPRKKPAGQARRRSRGQA